MPRVILVEIVFLCYMDIAFHKLFMYSLFHHNPKFVELWEDISSAKLLYGIPDSEPQWRVSCYSQIHCDAPRFCKPNRRIRALLCMIISPKPQPPTPGGLIRKRNPERGPEHLSSVWWCLGSSRFLLDLLSGHEPGRDAFHRVPSMTEEFRDAVECVPTCQGDRFMGNSLDLAFLLTDLEPAPACSADFQSAVSPSSTRQANRPPTKPRLLGHDERIGNPRYGRLGICATSGMTAFWGPPGWSRRFLHISLVP
jgi:hypothetical protein